MMRKTLLSVCLLVALSLSPIACGPVDENALSTRVAATVYAEQTAQARAFTPTPTHTTMPTPTRTGTPTRISTSTRTPTRAPTPTKTSTPLPDAIVNTERANVRAGPGTVYDIVGQAQQGDALRITGKNSAEDWLEVVTTDGTRGWIAASLLQVNTSLSAVAVTTIPPTPTLAATPTPTRPPRRLSTGTIIREVGVRNGPGELTVNNGRDLDAVVILTNKTSSEIAVYIQANDIFTIKGIQDGPYHIYFALGEDWDSDSAQFTRSAGFFRFEASPLFLYPRSTIFEATLHAVVGGEARVEKLSEEKFPDLK